MIDKKVELMAPAGAFDSLRAAIQAGADSVYFGVGDLNMRARATHNFTVEEIAEVVNICRADGVKAYLTLNTVMYDQDLLQVKQVCDVAKEKGVDAIIASDIAVLEYARRIGLPMHISTQANISNIEAVSFFSRYADTVVLARELSLEQIQAIDHEIQERNLCGPSGKHVEIEIFAHGALCVAISGKCYMSLAQYQTSANRGACLQACRRRYRVIEEETGKELLLDNKYIMSPKDLCTIGFLDQLINAGASVLKIEGRGRSPDYVYRVIKTYREAIDSISDGDYSQEKIDQWIADLSTVYNRGFWHGGYYLGHKLGEWSAAHGSKATKRKIYAGKVTNYFSKAKVAEVLLEAHPLQEGDEIIIIGPTTGIVESKIETLRSHDSGNLITIPIEDKLRRNDRVYIYKGRKDYQGLKRHK